VSPAGFTGSVRFTINYHTGTAGKTTVTVRESWKP
jgi:hypothetical protein